MSHGYLMSPPPRGWHIRGGSNYKSKGRPAVNPQRALVEWLALADAIESAGGRVAVLEPSEEPLLTGLMYTANAGWLRSGGPAPVFRLAQVSVEHRQAERPVLEAALAAAGFRTERAAAVWEGQADMCHLPDRVILSYGVRSVRESVDEVAAALPPGTPFHAARLREPYFHGDTCMDPLAGPRGPLWLAYPGAFADAAEYQVARRFASSAAEVVEVSEEDALAYGCNSLPVGGALLAPSGLSKRFKDVVRAQGYELRELDMGELFGKGGGGPRCLVNELRGLPEIPTSLSYQRARPALAARLPGYPTRAIA
ncbi:MAG: dimethylarginine dimethylaminohydrolase family protein [Myxococcales bacterium]